MKKYYYGLLLLFCWQANAQTVSKFAGQDQKQGASDGALHSATFKFPAGIAADYAGNLYIADRKNHLIRKISGESVSTYAGNGSAGLKNGSALSASFNEPSDITVDTKGNLYVADLGNHCIRKISTDGTVSTFAGSGKQGTRDDVADSATFSMPFSLALEKTGNLIVSDFGSHLIRKVSPDGLVTTIAGQANVAGFQNGAGGGALFSHPCGLIVSTKTGLIYIADRDNNAIRRLYSDGAVNTLCGSPNLDTLLDGKLSAAGFLNPIDLAFDQNEHIYVVENGDSSGKGTYSYHVRKINMTKKRVGLYAGKRNTRGAEDGVGEEAAFWGIQGITYVKTDKSFYVTDANNQLIRQIKQPRWDYDVEALIDSIFIPSAFTPNGDNVNDTWGVESRFMDSLTMGVAIDIYNEWGQKVFYTRSKNERWNGKTGDAENPTGTYRYIINAWYEDKAATVKGIVNLIR
ncbi:gliding motility-associated C-terminal domain-containing protein [Flexibacter flexilis DSM 6793]|uniref:Gliding motility-associated C-terminal domain-containing protein n=1 Tax=Flexibacter flexilis DSM 6793 TaxID=927664 RepID=A0A1I1NQL9_9BACT|nr:gliding motility-associated C-terminal domain-containing protein [Flexibacter flexilis]SFC99964.1 gliding motility-associated C-terminal domain-containing protein [Flexibacter flexilis DSM 6793]